jgi:uncharacterized protein (TIGR02186 family)
MTQSGRPCLLLACCAVALSAQAAVAERLVLSLSDHRVMVTSSFTGDQLVLFGAVEPDSATVSRRGGYDLVVTISGPRTNQVTRRKDRVLGIWVNIDSRVFVDVPAYLYVLSNRPVQEIANEDTLRRQQIGFNHVLLPQQIGTDTADVVRDDPFRVAFLRIKSNQGLYREVSNGVTLLTSNLFRATIPIPAEAPVGNYTVDVRLFADGAMVVRSTSAIEVYKAGFEQFVASAARNHGVLYGLATAIMALLLGWLGWLTFRRE